MMDTLQKLLPWVVSLPFLPKVLLSLVLVLFTAFVLLVLWSPATPPKGAQEQGMPPVASGSQARDPGHAPPTRDPYAEIVGPATVFVGKRAIYRAEFERNLEFEWHYTQPVKLTDRNVFVELGYVGQTETLTLTVRSPDGRTFSTSKMVTAVAAP